MAKKLFCIYTNPRFLEELYQPVLSQAFDNRNDVVVHSILDDSLLTDTIANNLIPPPEVIHRLHTLVEHCAQSGADCVVVGCTVINIAVQELSGSSGVPLLSLDGPLVDAVLDQGAHKAACISHNPRNAQCVARVIRARSNNPIAVDCICPPGAAHAFSTRNTAALARLYTAAAHQAAETVDVIACTHISADTLQFGDELPVPVLRTGALAVAKISEILHLTTS